MLLVYLENWSKGNFKLGSRLCKVCHREKSRQWREENPERHRERKRRWDKENPERKREYGLKRKYGITLNEYERMLNHQDGKCCICRKPPEEGKVLVVDHCHNSSEVRGLLCHKCNVGLGHFDDDIERLANAIEYLRIHDYN